MRFIAAVVVGMIAISAIGIGTVDAQQQAKPQSTPFTPQQQLMLKQLPPELQQRVKQLTPQQQLQLQRRMELWEQYRGWSITAKHFSMYDHCMRTTGKWTYRC
jgi:hypothetical protein